MRAALFLTALLGASAMAQDNGVLSFGEAMSSASTGALVPLQMPDGTKLWRYSRKEMKGPDVELRLTDVMAQAMAAARWCPDGWEETKRSTPTRGFVLIEGRCK